MMSISHTCSKTVAKASINFSLVWMQLLIKGSVGGFHQLRMQDLLRGDSVVILCVKCVRKIWGHAHFC